MAFASEREAFETYVQTFPETATLLIDTYDVRKGASNTAAVCEKLRGVRIDSGDLAAHAREVRAILDLMDRKGAKIVASGDLNEFRIEELLEKSAPIDIFGVGTELATSKDAPALGGIYKLVAIESEQGTRYPVKTSEDKASYPGRKQIFRMADPDGTLQGDILELEGEAPPEGSAPLLQRVMHSGKREAAACEPLEKMQERCRVELSRLPERLKRLRAPEEYPVRIGPALERLFQQAVKGIKK